METFSKSERLQSTRVIEFLFREGKSLLVYPFRLIWNSHPAEGSSSLKTAILVPRRNFRRAVDRNLVRRRIREVFRKNRHPVLSSLSKKQESAEMVILFLGKEPPPCRELEDSLLQTIRKWIGNYEKDF